MLIPGIAVLLLALLERLSRLRFRSSPLFRRFFTSDVIYLLTGFVAGGSLTAAWFATSSQWIGQWGLFRLAALNLPLWVTVPLALVAIDLGNYTAHLLLHRSSLLWEFHKVHHSSQTLDWLATFRSHLIEQTLRRLLAPALLILAGFPVNAVSLAGGIFIAWAMCNHSNLRLNLSFLEPVLITPRLHRLHHVPETENRNFGTIFTFWDRLRGVLVIAETGSECRFGVAGETGTYPQGWFVQLIEPVRRIVRPRSLPVST
jgi:sterol desaturase/sphingolipid hydroxylase (fatty acid hydroxylase superfamily)